MYRNHSVVSDLTLKKQHGAFIEGRGLRYNGMAGLPQDPHNHGAMPPSARPDVEPLADSSLSTPKQSSGNSSHHIMNYFLQNRLFSDKQYGFIKGRSTTLQLLNLLDLWTNSLEDGGQIDVIYTDFENVL